MNVLPRAKSENVVKINSQGEVLLFDSETRRSFSLNKPAAIIFSHCNGTTLFSYLSRRYQLSEDLIYFTLDELQKENLLAETSYISPFAEMERSEILRRIKNNSAINIPKITAL
jgi:hypothetical protein